MKIIFYRQNNPLFSLYKFLFCCDQFKHMPCYNSNKEYAAKTVRVTTIKDFIQRTKGCLDKVSLYRFCIADALGLDNQTFESFFFC